MGYIELDRDKYREDLRQAFEDDGWEFDNDGEYEIIASKGVITILVVELYHDKIHFDISYSVEAEAQPAHEYALLEALCVAEETQKGYDYISWQTGGQWFDAGCGYSEGELPEASGRFIIDGRSYDLFMNHDANDSVDDLPSRFEMWAAEQQEYAQDDVDELAEIAEDETTGIGDFDLDFEG